MELGHGTRTFLRKMYFGAACVIFEVDFKTNYYQLCLFIVNNKKFITHFVINNHPLKNS